MSSSSAEQHTDKVDWQTAITSALTSVGEKVAPIVMFLQEHQNEIATGYLALVPSIENLRDSQFRGILSIDKNALEILMTHGWYLNPNLSLAQLDLLIKAFDEDPVEASAMLAEQLDSTLTEIQDSLESNLPDRRNILREAFYAHRTGLYNLSVPVFLSQADGMWRDHLGRNLFHRGGPAEAAAEYEQQTSDGMTRSILDSFTSQIPLWMSEGDRGVDFNALNRHQVLHGESVDYGTREYSLKAISFLHFVAFVLDSGSGGASESS